MTTIYRQPPDPFTAAEVARRAGVEHPDGPAADTFICLDCDYSLELHLVNGGDCPRDETHAQQLYGEGRDR